ncbi:TetR/AcrR family transcriptional regulator [Kitasatospora sp. NPDC050463]|uniref:TetR/AcrR family transcriptional regulator n=1 Tax=Kitasatospora sp. NPDC050463 TaxID=3155786 RepID=UPI003410635A
MAADRLDEVLDAAYTCLTRYGVRRTTVDDIAGVMGVSRSAVYQYVRGKDDAFQRLAERLHRQALARARLAATAPGVPHAERIRGVLAVKLDLALTLAGDSPHTAELLDGAARLFAPACADFGTGLRELLTGLFTGLFAEADRAAQAGRTAQAGPASGTARASGADRAARVGPAEAADIAIALVRGLEPAPHARDLLGPAADALTTGLPHARAQVETRT